MFGFAAVAFLSCQSISTTSRLVGEWRYADKIQSCHYVFDRDGSFSGEVTYRGKRISEFKGRWSVEGDTLVYNYSADALRRIAAGSSDRDQILSSGADFFKIRAADGSERKYRRVGTASAQAKQ